MKFIEPTKENIEKYKEQYYQEYLREYIENSKLLKELNPNITDESLTDFIDKSFSPEGIVVHDTIVPGTNYDYYDLIKEIQAESIEKKMIVLLDKDKRPIGAKVVEIGDARTVFDPEGPMHSIFRYILENKNAKYFIDVHNHPRSVALKESIGDRVQTQKHLLLGNLIDVRLLDSCIINEFGYLSMFTKSPEIFKPEITNEFAQNLKKKNAPLYYALKYAIEGGFGIN